MNNLCVISGASRGMGLAIAEKFAAEGYDLAICARSGDKLKEIKERLEQANGINVHISEVDMTDESAIERWSGEILATDQPIQVLVNNTGTYEPGMISEDSPETLEKMMQVNFYSAYHLSRFLSGKVEKGGCIFNVSSVAGLAAYPNGGAYSISKFAVSGLSKALREELKEKGIRVTTLYPGAVRTSSWDGTDLPDSRFIAPEDIASIIYNTTTLSEGCVVEDITIRPQLGDI